MDSEPPRRSTTVADTIELAMPLRCRGGYSWLDPLPPRKGLDGADLGNCGLEDEVDRAICCATLCSAVKTASLLVTSTDSAIACHPGR